MNPWLMLGLVLAWIASLFAVGSWQNDAGHVAEKSAWQTRENIELAQANAKIIVLNQAVRDQEHRSAEQINQIAIVYEKDKSHEIEKRDAVIAHLRAGTLRLFDPASAIGTDGNTTGQTAASSRCGDGTASGELSGQTGEFLVSLASESDEVVRQLTTCQSVITEDRR